MIKLKGTSFYQDNINNISNTCVGILTPEVDNEFDENAMALFVNNLKVGYLQKDWMYEPWSLKVIKTIKLREGLVSLYKLNSYKENHYTGLRLVFRSV